jgi:hypothetical protein
MIVIFEKMIGQIHNSNPCPFHLRQSVAFGSMVKMIFKKKKKKKKKKIKKKIKDY